MNVAGRLLRGLSYLFHLALCLFFLGVALVTRGPANLHISTLPWKGDSLNSWLLWLSIIGLLATILAMTGMFRYLFPVWCLFALGLAVWGFFWNSQSSFDGEGGFKSALWFLAALLISFIVSVPLLRTRRASVPKH